MSQGCKPVVAITCSQVEGAARLPEDYFRAIEKANGVPFIVPAISSFDGLEKISELADAILFSGGVDVDPLQYGEEPAKELGEITPERDFTEINLCQMFFKKKKPIFGICRGIQLINVALGGKLYQDINHMPKVLKHYQQAPSWYGTHKVFIDEDSWLFEIFKNREILVNSFHHQAIKEVAPVLKVVARASDGIIEAVESKDKDFFIVGVQWHPERMFQRNEQQFRLFETFVEKVKELKKGVAL
ncbi:gamma-glutamyl-gamma-aminobutyrate hydrolase family protein [Pseudothermotoga thermarum]|uniref:Peptidase C26 n=1 Tax=Pseudothermotoga thermarum DSM 5069 TaxID=688269 RepID=F7YV34_9THEM|nr:gamma-glutamyl-gamma-aminobutyrate hydrolase family protein [Pseudothermotoga thermarum]AEH50326.1 peptidase C26 [Pseudothermotoga thermarum DSM 5069]